MRVRRTTANGVLTCSVIAASYEVAKHQNTENSANNAWNVNMSNGNVNNNNKNNMYHVRPVSADAEYRMFELTIWEAYYDCLKGKKSCKQALEYMSIAHEDVPRLAYEIWTGVYKPSPSTCFMVTFPKYREVFAAAFRDRIVHHWICLRLNPLFEERHISLGNVSHACRKGFGTRTAIGQAEENIMRVSEGYTKSAWVCKDDVVGFFMNIEKAIMWRMLHELVTEQYHGDHKEVLLRLTEITVMNRPEQGCILNSPVEMWQFLDSGKSLFGTDGKRGMPIGNLTTQLEAGYFMSFFDEAVARVFKGRNYGYTRSTDDIVIVCDDKDFMLKAVKVLHRWARIYLHIRFHEDKVCIQPVAHGVKFLGQWIKPYRRYTINRTVGRFEDKVKQCVRECEDGITPIRQEYWVQVFNSYFGFLAQTRSYRIRRHIKSLLTDEWYRYFILVNNRKIKARQKVWKR